MRDDLRGKGWPEPIVADSGNGGHLMYAIDLPAEDGGLVERCLNSLAARFSDEMVTIDTSVFNPARIWKLYGTAACKGDHTTDRPHRMSWIVSTGESVVIAGRELLEALAAEVPGRVAPRSLPGDRWSGV